MTDPDREASLVSHTSELAQLATEMDLLAIFKTRNNRIKATLETMESDLLASGKAGVEKRGSRYHIDGRIRARFDEIARYHHELSWRYQNRRNPR